jgi:thiol-disulfide isomerase/thioredoxin
MKPNILYSAVVHFFMLLFVYTGVAKIVDISSFRLELAASPFLGFAVGFLTWALPILELLIVVGLFIPAWRLRGLYASLILMGLFTLYVSGIVFIDDHLSCSCGGIVENLTPRQHLLFNGACMVLAWLGIRAGRGRNNESPQLRSPWWATSIVLLLFGSAGWIMVTAAKAPTLDKTGLEGRPLPGFDLVLADSVTHLNTRNIPTGQPFVIVGFSPYCPHCQGEIKDILHNMQQFQGIHIYLVTFFPLADLRAFYKKFQLEKYPNVTAAADKKDAFLLYFHQHSIPFTAVYDGKKRLAQVIPGRADMALLTRCINN